MGVAMKEKTLALFETMLDSAVRYLKWIVIAAAAIILLTGVYKVDSNEVAVVLRFGALTGTAGENQIKGPGLHFCLPNFIDEVVRVPVESVQELTVSTLYGTGDTLGGQVQNTGYVLTGDSNIVRMRIAVKYKISDPVRYALGVADIKGTITGIVSSEMTALIAGTGVDDVLTTEKNTLSTRCMANAQALFDSLRVGVTLLNIELTDITPPGEATQAFNDATTASVRKQTLIQQANDYRESALPAAEAEAKDLVSAASAAQSSSVAKASQIVAEFQGYYTQYTENPSVIMDGVFRSRVATLLKKSGAEIVVPDGGSARLILP